MARVYNFSAGPAVMPEEVLEHAAAEMLDWHGSGMAVMEMSHRDREFMSIAAQAESDLRELLGVPSTYKVLFLSGGASHQFAMVPMNLLRGKTTADYVNTGAWATKAIQEGSRYCEVNVAASSEAARFTTIPPRAAWRLNPEAAYVHYTPNETIGGVEFHWIPDTADVPLVADMSSTLLSRPIDVSRFGLIYAGAQKNIGPAGLTLVIAREELLGRVLPGTPTMFDYKTQADHGSLYNTPPTYAVYIAGLIFARLLALGGLEAMGRLNQRKAQKLYAAIDGSRFYRNPVDRACRSWMNVPFTLADPALDGRFLDEARHAGLVTLGGHRSVGGMRASLYNAMPESGVDALIDFMKEFEERHG
ncbi:MAG: 3-phosphoserine/phosphohydroxythreonine transaminase [Candidatus Rokubacteria bacterium]|nr:3-phosphoserine/phosphohydroxythreonine transaminase [Candidatus Rokubacteria bacterium]MBI3107357.1 3-phosphoserine/phosphohydroxythreonine transaminase [Candidatus Rokubacteria bacterium]